MEEYQKRVVDELSELEDKLEKLDGFLASAPEGIALRPVEEADMVSQSDAMARYARILRRRIGRFNRQAPGVELP